MDVQLLIVIGGAVVGFLYGMFGVGSAFATPVLALLGVPTMAAVVGPLPGLLPGSAAGAWSYAQRGKVDWGVARAAMVGAVPASILGAVASRAVGGDALLVLSGLVLFAVGLRVVHPGRGIVPEVAARRRASPAYIGSTAALVGFAAGLLANGGGFLLVPFFLLALGLDLHEAAGTSLVVAVTLTVPTLGTHALLGDVDWAVSALFAVGVTPGVLVGSRVAQQIASRHLRTAFGLLLMGFALWFVVTHVLGGR